MKIGIMGFGHLGKCFAQGLVKTGFCEKKDIAVSAKSEETKKKALEAGFSVMDNRELVAWAEVTVISLKSAVYEEVTASLGKEAFAGKTVVSFMAGVTLSEMKEKLGNITLVRAIPSIAIANGNGVTGYTKAPQNVENMLKVLGYSFEVPENAMEKVMAFASCGIGFAAYLLNAYQQAGIKMGFSPEESEKLTAITFQNAVELLHFEETVKQVATKGGATEQGVKCFAEKGIPQILEEGIQRAHDRMIK